MQGPAPNSTIAQPRADACSLPHTRGPGLLSCASDYDTTLDDIAARFGVCRKRVQELIDRAILKLHHAARAELSECELEAIVGLRNRTSGRRRVHGQMKTQVR
jgi:hypothetical protein